MYKFLILLITILFIQNCNLNKVVKRHGVQNLEKKSKKIILNQSNKNDIFELLGPPSTYSLSDFDTLIYIERSTSSSRLTKLGKTKLLKNNVLVLEMNNQGLAINKIFLDKEDMKKINFSKKNTKKLYKDNDFVYNFLSSVRRKINDPLGKKRSIND
mgnify:CR=1 FL=1